jgi:hypothetical protein
MKRPLFEKYSSLSSVVFWLSALAEDMAAEDVVAKSLSKKQSKKNSKKALK